LDGTPRVRVQLCGRLAAEIDGRRIEEDLPGRPGRLLFAYLTANRDRVVNRDELIEAVWPNGKPNAVDADLRSLLSKTRRATGTQALGLRSRFRLDLPDDAWIDVDVAAQAVHTAEAAVSAQEWSRAWAASHSALCIARRPFLAGEDPAWVLEWRNQLDGIESRALECYAAASFGIGGSELSGAESAARLLVQKEPYRESGHRLLMETLIVQGNGAEAMHVYAELRRLLREQLGISPSPSTQALHKRLLGGLRTVGPDAVTNALT
jgi:SARP family transcriptional regulator, regulator of embCAB operon